MYNNDTERLFAEGGMNDEGGTVDPVSGNDVPPGSLQNEVRDDIDAKLSEGEFVIPADVVRYIGLERLMKLRDEAKQGLSRMNKIGQMGNSQEVANPEALQEEDGFDSEIDDIMKEVDGEQMGEKKFVDGGFAVPGTDLLDKYNIPKTSITNPALDVRAYKNKEGRVMYITFFNDKPSIQIPAGYEFAGTAGQFIAETKKTDDKKEVVTATGTIDTSGGGDGPTGTSGATVGGSTGVSGTGIGNSAIGIAIGAVTNAVANAMGLSNTPNDAIAVTDATTTTGVSTSANAAGLSESAAAISVDDASISEGVSEGTSSNGAPGTVGSTDATAAADNSGNTTGDDGDGGDGGDGDGGDGLARGGLVVKRKKKATPAKKRGIASKK
jgi:hypothetical protein